MGFYERIVKYLANNDVVHLPLRMGGDKESINMIFNSWHDFVLVKRLLNKKNVATDGLVISEHYYGNNLIELKVEGK
jgi:hypothetical protein